MQTMHQQTQRSTAVFSSMPAAKLLTARRYGRKQHICAAPAAGTTGGRPLAAIDQTSTVLPQALVPHLQRANQQWLQESLTAPLRIQGDTDADCKHTRVFILGVCCWAPLQHELVAAALTTLSPDEVLIEQPAASSTCPLLPHPAWVQTVLDFELCVSAAAPGQATPGRQQQQQQQQWQEFTSELRSSSSPAAKVGKDILDPFESFGYYGGLDFVKQADSIAAVLRLCGFLPGQEVVKAAEHALTQGIPLRCIDAPLKLQERWVRSLLSSFDTLDEQTVNSYAPLKDFNANQELASTLPAAATAWDKQLADAAAQLQQQQVQPPPAGGSGADSEPAAAAAEQQALLLFKCSKATAAALLPPDAAQQAEVLARMARLQPLKWRHFALRQQYMAQQIKEAAVAAAKSARACRSNSSTGATLLVIVGRQHCAALRSLWSDPASSLWRTQVLRSFAPSVVDPEAEPALAAGGRVTQPQAEQGAGDVMG